MFNLVSVNLSGLLSSFERDYKQEDATFMTNKKLDNMDALEAKFNMLL